MADIEIGSTPSADGFCAALSEMHDMSPAESPATFAEVTTEVAQNAYDEPSTVAAEALVAHQALLATAGREDQAWEQALSQMEETEEDGLQPPDPCGLIGQEDLHPDYEALSAIYDDPPGIPDGDSGFGVGYGIASASYEGATAGDLLELCEASEREVFAVLADDGVLFLSDLASEQRASEVLIRKVGADGSCEVVES